MGRPIDAVPPARFLITFGHFIAVVFVLGQDSAVAYAGLELDPSSSSFDNAKSEVASAVAFAVFCFLFDFAGLMLGFSAFFPQVNALQVLFHFFGAILTSQMVLESWDYRSMWKLVWAFNFPTAVIEIFVLGLVAVKAIPY